MRMIPDCYKCLKERHVCYKCDRPLDFQESIDEHLCMVCRVGGKKNS